MGEWPGGSATKGTQGRRMQRAIMRRVRQSGRNVLRSSGRLILMVTLLGVSLMFVASMVSLSGNSQQELATIHNQVGTTITIHYATNDANANQQGRSGTNGPGFF